MMIQLRNHVLQSNKPAFTFVYVHRARPVVILQAREIYLSALTTISLVTRFNSVFIPQILIENLVCGRYYFKHWGNKIDNNHHSHDAF